MNPIGPHTRTVKETRCKIIENNHESTTYLFVFMNTIVFSFFPVVSQHDFQSNVFLKEVY